MNDLKPCPFCGGANLTPHLSDYGHPSWVRCEDCKALVFFPWNKGEDSAELASTWNNRADGWISVKDKLPEPWATVLVWSKNDGYEIMMHDVDTDGWLNEERGCQSFNNFPYWQPLPEPPKEEQE